MSKYRFKTKEEFIRDGIWNDKYDVPKRWVTGGNMNRFLGQDISIDNNARCAANESIYEGGWWFSSCDYVLKEESKKRNANGFEYFGDTLMEVSDSGEVWITGVVFGKKNGRYVAWETPLNIDSLEDAKTRNNASSWKYARPIKTKLTLKQVAEKFGLKEHEIEIIES